jgi:acetyl esterase/lipase
MNLLERTPPTADHRLQYGPAPQQFGDLWIPSAAAYRSPLIVFVHGGWWSAAYDLSYASFLCAAMKAMGVAVWSLEYRRVGDPAGGWPGTMQDIAAGMDHVLQLAEAFPLDTNRIIAAGHSAGGQLAFWLAARHHIPHTSVLAQSQPKLALKGVVGLAGAVDLRLTLDLGGLFTFTNGGPAVKALMGGPPAQVPDRYAAADPGELLPLGLPQILVQGDEDDQIPPALPARWAQAAKRQGDPVDIKIVPGADHFDVVDPQSNAWPVTRDALLRLLHT